MRVAKNSIIVMLSMKDGPEQGHDGPVYFLHPYKDVGEKKDRNRHHRRKFHVSSPLSQPRQFVPALRGVLDKFIVISFLRPFLLVFLPNSSSHYLYTFLPENIIQIFLSFSSRPIIMLFDYFIKKWTYAFFKLM